MKYRSKLLEETAIARIKTELGREGFKLRRQPGAAKVWRVTGRFPGFYLLIQNGSSWQVRPVLADGVRDQIVRIVNTVTNEATAV